MSDNGKRKYKNNNRIVKTTKHTISNYFHITLVRCIFNFIKENLETRRENTNNLDLYCVLNTRHTIYVVVEWAFPIALIICYILYNSV